MKAITISAESSINHNSRMSDSESLEPLHPAEFVVEASCGSAVVAPESTACEREVNDKQKLVKAVETGSPKGAIPCRGSPINDRCFPSSPSQKDVVVREPPSILDVDTEC